MGIELKLLGSSDNGSIERGISGFCARRQWRPYCAQAFPEVITHRKLIIKLAAQHRLPAVYPLHIFATDGGLISYGPDVVDGFRQAASYVDRILKGEKPADLPVQAPTKYELVINLKTAKALGLTIPPAVLWPRPRGDRVRRREVHQTTRQFCFVWPLTARAQTAVPVVGFINGGSRGILPGHALTGFGEPHKWLMGTYEISVRGRRPSRLKNPPSPVCVLPNTRDFELIVGFHAPLLSKTTADLSGDAGYCLLLCRDYLARCSHRATTRRLDFSCP